MLLILVYMLMTSDSIVAELIDPGDYIDTVLAYYRHRNARIITHFTCFPTCKQSQKHFISSVCWNVNEICILNVYTADMVDISMALKTADIQSRFITDFTRRITTIDTPMHSFEGYVVDLQCANIETIFANTKDHGIIFKNNNLWLFIDNNVERDVDSAMVCCLQPKIPTILYTMEW